MSLQELAEHPFELLLELERRARVAIAAREGVSSVVDEWVGIGFRLGAELFNFFAGGRVPQDKRPAAGSGITAAGAVGIELDFGKRRISGRFLGVHGGPS